MIISNLMFIVFFLVIIIKLYISKNQLFKFATVLNRTDCKVLKIKTLDNQNIIKGFFNLDGTQNYLFYFTLFSRQTQ